MERREFSGVPKTTGRGLEDGGRGGDRSVQPLKKIRTDERTKTANERPSTTEGTAKRPRRVATPATAKRSSPSAPPTNEVASKRLRAQGVHDKAPVHGRPPDGSDKRARLQWGSSDSKKRAETTAPTTLAALLG